MNGLRRDPASQAKFDKDIQAEIEKRALDRGLLLKDVHLARDALKDFSLHDVIARFATLLVKLADDSDRLSAHTLQMQREILNETKRVYWLNV